MKKKSVVIFAVGLCLAVGTGLYYGRMLKNKEISFIIDGENWSAEGTGSAAVIKLPANPNTGYEWSVESVEGPVSVKLEYVEDEHDTGVVGVGGTELVIVKTEGEGLSELIMKYARNWERKATDRICQFEIISDKKGNIQNISQTELYMESEPEKGEAAVSIIGGADGPTSIFIAGKLGDGDKVNSDTIPLIMVEGALYFLTGESDIDGRCKNMDGEIMETVDGSEVPVKDGQSNFGAGYGYQFVDENQIDVYMPYGNPDEWKWMRFVKTGAESSQKEPYVVKAYGVTDPELMEEDSEKDPLVTIVKYYEMSDGTWKTDTHTYQYRLEITGRMNHAAKDSTFVFLSNRKDITFEQAWKASGFSSSMDDYFDEDVAKFVAMK